MLVRIGATGVLGVVTALMAACGDDGGGDAGAFCDDAVPALGTLNTWAEQGDPAASGLDESVVLMEDADPPSAIADEWEALLDSLVTLVEVDGGDPQAVAAATSGVAERTDDLEAVQDYVGRSC